MLSLSDASNIRPLALLFDTCEALKLNIEEWQRDGIVCPVVSLNKPIIFIISGRQDQYRERQADSGDNNIRPTKGYADRLTDPPPISWDISRFADPEITDYLRQHGFEANSELVDFVQHLAKGVPYAVQLIIQAFKKLGVEYVKENFPPKDISTFSAQEIVALVTERFLRYGLYDEDDLEKIRGLAVLRNWDEGGLCAVWKLPSSNDATRILLSLQSRYGFILPEKKLHEIIRDFIREDLRVANISTARDLGSRISSYYYAIWQNTREELPTSLERLAEPRWRQQTLNTLNALCWHDEDSAIRFLATQVVESMTIHIRYADALLSLIDEFSKSPEWFSNKAHHIIIILKQIVRGGDKEELNGLSSLLHIQANLLDDQHLPILYFWKARNLFRAGSIHDALQECVIAKEKLERNNDPWLKIMVANLLNSIGWQLGYDENGVRASRDALTALTHAVDIQPEDGSLHIGLGVMQMGLDMNEEAVKSISYGMELIEENAPSYNWLGHAYNALGQNEDAITTYKRSIQLDSKSPYAWRGLARVYKNLGQFDDARKCYDRSLELDPESSTTYAVGVVDLLWRQGRIQEAIDMVNNSITLKPNDSSSWNSLAYIYRQANRKEESKRAFMQALDLNKEDNSWNGLGNISRDLGNLDAAIEAYKNALELTPDEPIYQDNLANVYLEQGNYALAFGIYSQMIASNPKSYAHVSLAMYYWKIDDHEKANEEIRIAQSLVETHPIYIKARLEAVKRNTENAIKHLKACLANGSVSIAWIKRDPVFDFIRDEPGFIELVDNSS